MEVHVIADFVCPWCYIGKRQLEQAMAERPDLDVDVRWLPFQLNPQMPEEGVPIDVFYLEHFGETRPSQIQDNIRQAAEPLNLPINFEKMTRIPNTLRAHRLARYASAAGVVDKVAESLFKANFTEGKDIGDMDVLLEIAADAGLDVDETRAYLESGEGQEEVLAEEHMVREMGVQGVPFIIMARQIPLSGAVGAENFARALDAAALGRGASSTAQ